MLCMKYQTKKPEKNYFRNYLLELCKKTNGAPLLLRVKYKYKSDCNNNSNWEYFTTVRPYISHYKTKTICHHINVWHNTVLKYFKINRTYHNRTFYLLGYPDYYIKDGVKRGCIRLAEDLKIRPVIFNNEKYLIDRAYLLSYKFSLIWIRDCENDKLYGIK